MRKSDKELAFLHDLYVATDWGERFAELVDEHVELPKEGRALYVASGTGGHALALAQRGGAALEVVAVEESEEQVELARAKAASVEGAGVDFRHAQLEDLGFQDEQFDLVVGDASLVAPERLPEMLAEMVRVAAPGATVSMSVPSSSSFGEFFSVFWEALANAGYTEAAEQVGALIGELPTVTDLEALARREALEEVRSWTSIEEFDFASGREFLDAPLVEDFLLAHWLDSLPDEEGRANVLEEVARIIDDDRHEGDFSLTVKATIVVGKKAG
ncbi:MAG: class I SAM-dependent methyltransferase [Acidobacteria bacterium]|nr:class I SAM-dependent methyltransferase [Acidobacteriota bacterium]